MGSTGCSAHTCVQVSLSNLCLSLGKHPGELLELLASHIWANPRGTIRLQQPWCSEGPWGVCWGCVRVSATLLALWSLKLLPTILSASQVVPAGKHCALAHRPCAWAKAAAPAAVGTAGQCCNNRLRTRGIKIAPGAASPSAAGGKWLLATPAQVVILRLSPPCFSHWWLL